MLGVLDKNPQRMRDDWTFEKDVTIGENLAVTGNTTVDGTATVADATTLSSTLDVAGITTFAKRVELENGLVLKILHLTSTTVLDGSAGNFILCDTKSGTAFTLTLPRITAALEGFKETVKQYNTSGTAVAIAVTPASGQKIESTRGTYTGTSDTSIDAKGDCRSWVAHYDAACASNCVWLEVHRDIA